MKELKQTIIAGGIGTSFMTLFSYVVSESKDKIFEEPEALKQVIRNLIPGIKKQTAQLAAWQMHYLIGFLFAASYIHLWKTGRVRPTLKNGVLLGIFSGLIGVIGWKAIFKLSPVNHIDHDKYYRHLVVTHAVFGMFATIGYKLCK